ncbi:MAG: exodeoxyribonuclease III [Zetaproteobacteria bacterium]|nr:MAG: exodeoxyribonuclease III [Zetaproteobacteria bacterium]
MRLVSWNVNSLNVRLPHVEHLLDKLHPDVLALQETKLPDDRFPSEAFEQRGFQVSFAGQKTYNGVALISRYPLEHVRADLPGFNDAQRRVLAATVAGVRIINVYVPNGQEPDSEKFAYKCRWLDALLAFVADELSAHDRLVVMGDFNIAPADMDVHDAARWRDKIMCTALEREYFRRLLALGLVDAVREQLPEDRTIYTWWDYRLSAFRRGWGLRIDHVLLSESLRIRAAGVDVSYRAMDRPSDHAPVWVDVQ